MKTVLIMTIEHSKPIPDLTDIAAGRVYTLDGVKDVTATIQETAGDMGRLTDWLESNYQDKPWIREQAVQIESACTPEPSRSFWSWLWRTQS